jgi:hypothetical protein
MIMSGSSQSGSGPAGASKEGVSPVRNIIGLIVLLIVLIVGGLQVWAKTSYNSAVSALDERTKDESKDLLKVNEAENLIGHPPDDAGREVDETYRKYLKKTYTWHGLLQSYTLTAFYTRGTDPRLHHFETADKPFIPEATGAPKGETPTATGAATQTAAGGEAAKEKSKSASDMVTEKAKTDADKAKEKSKSGSDAASDKSKAGADKAKDTSKSGSDAASDKSKADTDKAKDKDKPKAD